MGRTLKLKKAVLSAALLLLSPAALHADTVYFNHGTSLKCKVKEFSKVKLVVLLDTSEQKRVVLDPSTVKKIELDYDSRLASLDAEDYLGHYKLGKWCAEMSDQDPQMLNRAISRFLYCCGKSGVPNDAYLYLGRLFEKAIPPKLTEALSYYQEYLKLVPNSEEAKKAIERLQKQLATNAPSEKAPASNIHEGLEKRRWYIENWGNKGKTRVVTDKGNGNNQLLEMTVTSKDKDKAAFRLPINQNLSQMESVTFDTYNPNDFPIQVKIALIGGPEGAWCEQLPVITLPAKAWTKGIQTNFDRKYWKIFVRGKQKSLSSLPLLNPVRNLLLLVMPTPSNATIYLDSMTLVKKK